MDNQDEIIIPTPNKNITPIKDVSPIKDILPREKIYSQITGATCDCIVIRLLKALLSGRYGSFTGQSSYLYQSLISRGLNSSLSNALQGLSNEELTHMGLLGNAITLFGGNPRFSNGQGTPWSTRNINYENDIPTFLKNNIKREEFAIKELERAIQRITNESLRKLLREIIDDKRNHIVILQGFLT